MEVPACGKSNKTIRIKTIILIVLLVHCHAVYNTHIVNKVTLIGFLVLTQGNTRNPNLRIPSHIHKVSKFSSLVFVVHGALSSQKCGLTQSWIVEFVE